MLSSFVPAFDRAATAISKTVYERGDGVRYLLEQTLGFTVPRTVQQLKRTHGITGENNPMAAREMAMRDIAADLMDTVLPGFLSTLVIGGVIDTALNKQGLPSVSRYNIGLEAMNRYEQFAKASPTAEAFYAAAEADLAKTIGAKSPLKLQETIQDMIKAHASKPKGMPMANFVQPFAEAILKRTDALELAPLLEPLRDLMHLEAATQKLPQIGNHWGQWLAEGLQKNEQLGRFKMLGNVLALTGSLSIPFVIRWLTRKTYGHDAFPGTKELADHFGVNESSTKKSEKAKSEFHWFPYLSEAAEKGNWAPTALTAGFFATLASAVYLLRFKKTGLPLTKLSSWLETYQFGRSFPWTTVTQMELTYGALCGFRLLSSRDDAEFRETIIRDCAMGWPTLTYFFPAFRDKLAQNLDQNFAKRFGAPHIITNAQGHVRELLSKVEFSKMPLNAAVETVLPEAQKAMRRITVLSGLVSLVALAFAEPQLAIWMTNHLEVKKLKALKQQQIHKQVRSQPYTDVFHGISPVYSSQLQFAPKN